MLIGLEYHWTEQDEWVYQWVMKRYSRDERAAIRSSIDPSLCSLCRQFIGDILTKEIWLDRPLRWLQWREHADQFIRNRAQFLFAHRKVRSFKQNLQLETCRLCRLLIHARLQLTARYIDINDQIYINVEESPSDKFEVTTIKPGYHVYFRIFSKSSVQTRRLDGNCSQRKHGQNNRDNFRDSITLPPSSSAETFCWVARCLQLCTKLHPTYKRTIHCLPTRVIDVGVNKGTCYQPRLLLSKGIEAPYLALSYCWRNTESTVLQKKTLNMFQKHIPSSALPKTIRDAIEVTRTLGLRYLWVDALCIMIYRPRDCIWKKWK